MKDGYELFSMILLSFNRIYLSVFVVEPERAGERLDFCSFKIGFCLK